MCDQCESDFEELLDNVVERHGSDSYEELKQLQKQLKRALTQARENAAEDANDMSDDELNDIMDDDDY